MSESARSAVWCSSVRPQYVRSVAAISALLLGCALVLAAPVVSMAQAEETPAPAVVQPRSTPATTEEPQSTPAATEEPQPNATTAPAPSPQIASPPNGQFIGSNRTTVSGLKAADQQIQLLSPRGGDPLCIVDDSATSWSCTNVYLQNGPNITLRVIVTGNASLSDEISVAVLGAPTVLGGLTGSDSNGWVRGTGHPDAIVTASLPNGDTCNSTADTSGAWACLFSGLGNGTQEVTASQISAFSRPSSSNSSAAVAIVFDVTAPDAPVVTAPSAGAQVPVAGAQYSGTGETGAVVTVFAGAYSVCSAAVTGGTWTCSAGGVAAGTYSVIAVQKDNAGNVGPGSTPLSVSYAAETTPTPTPTGSASATPPVTPTPGPAASPSPDGSVAVPGAPAQPSPSTGPGSTAPDPQAAAPENDEAGASVFPGQWNDPTRFAAAIGPTGTGSPFPWLQAGLLALGALLLIAVPTRMLAGTISRTRRGRPQRALPSLAGRNRVREEFEVAPTVRLNRWLRGGAALIAAATFVMLSGPVVDQPAYLRLLVAVVIGLVLVNAVAILVPLWWSSRVLRLRGTVTFLPRYLLLIAAAAIASRLFDVHPALLFGLLGSVTFTAKTDAETQPSVHPTTAQPTTAQRGQLAAVRVGALTAFAVLAWSIGSLLPGASDFSTSLAAETGNTIVLAAIGSAVLILVPIGHTSGRRILAWSPLLWTGLTVVTYGILFAALAPMVEQLQSTGTGLALWIAAATFATLCASAWVWQRFVAPTQR